MPRIGLAGGKGSYHAGVLSSLAKRFGQRVQPEIESRPGDGPRRGGGTRRAAFIGGAVAGAVSKPGRQPRDQVRTPAAGSLQFLPARGGHPMLVVAARAANTGRVANPLRAHAFL